MKKQKRETDRLFDKLTLANDFVFKMVLENETICKRLIEMVLGRKVARVVSLETEKTLTEGFFSHTVRFDVYVEGSAEVIDFEIQCSPVKGIEKRVREYQANLDVEQLSKGESYSSLKESWIVFFCTFDPFGLGLPIYVVEQVFKGTGGVKYDDGTCRILYNATKWAECKDGEIQAVLKYMQTGLAESGLVRDIEAAIEGERELQAMRNDYMAYDMKLCEVRDETWDEAWQEASHDTKIETARRALECGIPADTVAKFTGLPIEEVRELL